ncbi:putative Ran GTPase activator [Meredithblackwellia eburnea MCA 4105]
MASSAPALHPDSSSTVLSLQGLTLKFDSLDQIKPYLEQLPEHVEEVRFGGNTLGIDACKGVGDALSTKTSLKTADFSDIFTGRLISEIPQSLRSLCDSLLHLPSLVSLDLSDNAFGGRSVEPMLELISSHVGLKVLKLNNNGMGPAGGTEIANALLANANKAKKEGRKPNLQTIICGRNRLENGSAPFFAAAFAALGSLVEVRMPQNGIRMEGIEAIAKGLRKNPDLEILDLQDNTATERGSRAIAGALSFWPKLHTLNLSDCLLRPRGGLSIMRSLSSGSNPKLATLKLQSNELDPVAVTELSVAIKLHLPLLVALELNGNYGESEEDECYVAVKEALEKWDHGDALDELDELEERDEEEEEEEEEEIESEDEEVEDKQEETVVEGKAETGGEDVRANEAQVVKDDKVHENEDEPKNKADNVETDDLADALGKVHIK